MISHSRFLRRLGEPVNIRHKPNHRFSTPPRSNPGCRYSRDSAQDLEVLFFEDLSHEFGSLEFLESQLGKTENRIHHDLIEIVFGIDPLHGLLLELLQIGCLIENLRSRSQKLQKQKRWKHVIRLDH